MRIQSSALKPHKDRRFTYTKGVHVAKPKYDTINVSEQRCEKGTVRKFAHVANDAHEAWKIVKDCP